jgi:hypothetical protein
LEDPLPSQDEIKITVDALGQVYQARYHIRKAINHTTIIFGCYRDLERLMAILTKIDEHIRSLNIRLSEGVTDD